VRMSAIISSICIYIVLRFPNLLPHRKRSGMQFRYASFVFDMDILQETLKPDGRLGCTAARGRTTNWQVALPICIGRANKVRLSSLGYSGV
jgi:hypothetical protein